MFVLRIGLLSHTLKSFVRVDEVTPRQHRWHLQPSGFVQRQPLGVVEWCRPGTVQLALG
jgi:hypothetical protein